MSKRKLKSIIRFKPVALSIITTLIIFILYFIYSYLHPTYKYSFLFLLTENKIKTYSQGQSFNYNEYQISSNLIKKDLPYKPEDCEALYERMLRSKSFTLSSGIVVTSKEIADSNKKRCQDNNKELKDKSENYQLLDLEIKIKNTSSNITRIEKGWFKFNDKNGKDYLLFEGLEYNFESENILPNTTRITSDSNILVSKNVNEYNLIIKIRNLPPRIVNFNI